MMNTISDIRSLPSKGYGHQAAVAFILALVLTLFTAMLAPSTVLAEDAEKNVVVHIGQYTNDLHSATMGLGLAGNYRKPVRRLRSLPTAKRCDWETKATRC